MLENRIFFVWVNLHVSWWGKQQSKCERAIRLVYQLFFFKPWSTFSSTNTIWKQLCLKIQIAPTRQPFKIIHMFIWTYFLAMTDPNNSQNINISSWITLYYIRRTKCRINATVTLWRIKLICVTRKDWVCITRRAEHSTLPLQRSTSDYFEGRGSLFIVRIKRNT